MATSVLAIEVDVLPRYTTTMKVEDMQKEDEPRGYKHPFLNVPPEL